VRCFPQLNLKIKANKTQVLHRLEKRSGKLEQERKGVLVIIKALGLRNDQETPYRFLSGWMAVVSKSSSARANVDAGAA